MSSKDKETKSIQEKLKQFFRLRGASSGNLRPRVDFALTEEIERDISRDAPIQVRLRTIRDLSEDVLKNRLENNAIETLWNRLQDLLQRDQPREHRHLTFTFLRCLVQGQFERLGIMRSQFFRIIKLYDHPEDTADRFELLTTLTFNGKDILYFEAEVGPFLLKWMDEVILTGKTQDYLILLVNVVKFNAAYLDEEVITGLVQNTCVLCCRSAPNQNQTVVLACLQLLDTVVCYSNLPTESLATFIGALCRTVNHEEYCQNSWRIMRNLLGTHMGHSALYTMCRILQEPTFRQDHLLLRGAVFHVNQALWGTRPVASLHCTPTSVLPSFISALQCNHPIVVYEVMLSVQGLVTRRGSELHDPAWDILLDIIEDVIEYVEKNNNINLVVTHLHETLCSIEKLIELGRFNGSIKRLYDLVERCAHSRPESSVLRLVNYLSEGVVPTKHMWLAKLYTLMNRYYKQESRTNIRLKVLEILSNVIKLNRSRYEDELIERIVVPHLQHVAADPDVVVRNSCAELLVDLCLECDSKRCSELLDILDKLLNRAYEAGINEPISEIDMLDLRTVVIGLIKIFQIKMHRLPSAHAVRVYMMLVAHLENHYSKPAIYEHGSLLRYKIFDCFLKVRANSSSHLGCFDGNGVMRYSPYLCVASISGNQTVTPRGQQVSSPPPALGPAPPSPSPAQTQAPIQLSSQTPAQLADKSAQQQTTQVSLRNAFRVFISCLTKEKDWEVLHLLLKEIPKVMQNKVLVLSKHGAAELDVLASALCSMLMDKTLSPESLRNAPKLNRFEFHMNILPVLASLASYHMYLEPVCQQKIIRHMVKFGLVPRCPQQCITALTICVLEMQEVMVKLLPEVLLDLSKISATVHIAVPVLEFLSTLTRLPTVFGNFVGDQYMAVFAISLPYTNPFKYNHYIVSLAHHVIAVWFLKCRIPFRKDFVKFITTGLQTNALIPFEETNIRSDLVHMNEDSSNRKRSSSLTEQGSRRRDRPTTVDLRPPVDKTLHTFYEELTETCIDLMARYTFSPCSALPKRLPTAEFLLSGGQSMSWLMGNKLITVTTSGCAQKALKHGLCDKCWLLCQRTPSTENRDESGVTSGRATRQNSGEQKSTTDVSPTSPTDRLDQLSFRLNLLKTGPEKQLCSCWCQGWAEIHVRRPTGDMSWVMRIQNQITQQHEFPLNEVSSLFMSSLNRSLDITREECEIAPLETDRFQQYQLSKINRPLSVPIAMQNTPTLLSNTQISSPLPVCVPQSVLVSIPSIETTHSTVSGPISIPDSRGPSRQSSRESDESESFYYEDGTRARNPVRRSNSSPEMSASWKNPFMERGMQEINKGSEDGIEGDGQKKNKKDMRVSCEAIPEEISGLGTTPPSSTQNPTLLSCHSCPGEATQNTTTITTGLASKPPQSPTLSSPGLSRHSSSDSKNSSIDKPLRTDKKFESKSRPSSIEKLDSKSRPTSIDKPNQLDASIPPMRRDRGHTISVMSPVSKPRLDSVRRTGSPRPRDSPKSGINPSFVFLQLYHAAHFGNNAEKPLLVGSSQMVQRAVKILDCIPPYETHKVGVVYVGPGQSSNECDILRNNYGSGRYVEFLHRLGTLISLKDADPQTFFLGGLEQNGNDGKFAYIWQDDVMQVIFHVATLMPCKDSDPSCNNKKMHIGNNYVTIVYNESGEDFSLGTIKGQFNYANIIIEPLDHATNLVKVKSKDELSDYITHSEPKIISDQNLAILARQMALHANLASMVNRSLKAQGQDPYASNWLERLRKIKHLRTRVLQEYANGNEFSSSSSGDDVSAMRSKRIQDFTEYT